MFDDLKEVSVRSDLQVHSPTVVVECYIIIPNKRQSDQTIWITVLSVKSCKLSSGHSILPMVPAFYTQFVLSNLY